MRQTKTIINELLKSNISEVSRATGISRRTLYNLINSEYEIRLSNLLKIDNYLKEQKRCKK